MVSGHWMNTLEFKAILFGLKSFFSVVCDAHNLIYCDNTSAVHKINKKGTSHSLVCNEVVHEIWN